MLNSLSVKNLAIIDSLSLELGPGLCAFTGETGAGKSIIIEALGFALGERASAESVRSGAQKAEVEAVFSIDGVPRALRKKHSLSGPAVRLRREIDARGRSRAFIEGSAVPVADLLELGDSLVDFHGQNEHQTILRPAVQLDMLDSFAGLESERKALAAAYDALEQARAALNSLSMSSEEKERLLDLYRFQLSEIEGAELRPGEDDELDALLPRFKNAEKLSRLAGEATELLYSGENAAVESSGRAQRLVEELALLDPSLSETARVLRSSLAQVEDCARELAHYREALEADPAELDRMMERQDKIARLKKKYAPGIRELLDFAAMLRGRIDALASTDERRAELEAAVEKARKNLMALAEDLHDKRAAAAGKLAARVLKEIKPLGFPEVKFSVSVEMDEQDPGKSGADSVDFLFSPNPGQPLKPLKAIASGGEMSRVMLGLKTVLAAQDGVSTLVFDEVDAGVGGVVGRMVGEKMKALSNGRQVFCVTHLAQVAAFGDSHFCVSKDAKGQATLVRVASLDGKARVEEIARMLGGRKDSSKAGLTHASELLAECKAAMHGGK